MPVVIRIQEEGTPAPIGAKYIGIIGDLRKMPVAIIYLQGIANILMIKTCFEFTVIQINIIKSPRGLEPVIIIRNHICRKYIRMAIVINIRQVGTHGGHADMLQAFFQLIPESAILLIDIEIIFFDKIIAHIDIRVAVIIQITNGYAQSETDETGM